MRIAFLSPVGTIGGAEQVLMTALAALIRTGISERPIVVIAGPGPLAGIAAGMGAEVIELVMPSTLSELADSTGSRAGVVELVARSAGICASTLQYRAQLTNLLRQLAPDIVHSNGLKMHLLGAATKPRNAGLVWHMHDFVGLRLVAPWLLRLARRGATAIAISQAVARDVRRVLPGLKTTVLQNVIDLEKFAPGTGDGAWLDRLAGLPPAPEDVVRVGLVATYALWKGHGLFLEAAAALNRSYPALPLRYYIIGGPVYQTRSQRSEVELRALAGKLGVAGRVGFIGFQREIAPVYRALDVVVHASTLPEPFGLTIAEAMGCGRAVVATLGGGATELFVPEVEAIGTVAGDVQALASALHRLAADRGLRLRLGQSARQAAVMRFNPDRYGPGLMRAYATALRQVRWGSQPVAGMA